MIDKWQSQIAKICSGIADVSQSMIEVKSQPHFYDGITTREIDEITLRAIVDLIDVESNPDVGHTNYQFVAGKQRLSMLRKDVFGEYMVPHIHDIVKRTVEAGFYTADLLEWYSEEDWDKMNSMLDHSKDEQYSYAAIEQLIEKYLVKNRSTKEIFETPQIRYMVAAATIFHNEEPNTARMKYVKEYYAAASDGLFTLATPVLAGLGTPTKQFSSCFPAGQPVLTSDGYKNIEDVHVGDEVCSLSGKNNVVEAVRVKDNDKNFVSFVHSLMFEGRFTCTEDHKIFALKRKTDNPAWYEAKDLLPGDYVHVPCDKTVVARDEIKVSDLIDLSSLGYEVDDNDRIRKVVKTPGRYSDRRYDLKVTNHVLNTMNFNDELFRLLGYFIAEGHIHSEMRSVHFTLGTHEKETWIKDIVSIIERIFGVNVVVRTTGTYTTISCFSVVVAHLFKTLTGTGFNTKRLSDYVTLADPALQKQLLIGVFRGDGCVYTGGAVLGLSNKWLVTQLAKICIRCGLSPRLSVKHPSGVQSGGITARNSSYTIHLSTGPNGVFIESINKNWHKVKPVTRIIKRSIRVGDEFFTEIRDIQVEAAPCVPVYDIQVANERSFTVHNATVHNCVLIRSDDDLDSIFASGEMMAKYASKRAGIGLEVGRLRSLGSPIRGGEILHTGLLPFLKKFYGDLRSCCVTPDTWVEVLDEDEDSP